MSIIGRIKYDGPPNVLVWRDPRDNFTLGSQLIVNESQEAIFYKGGKALDLFGPGTHTLSAANIPLLQSIINLPFGGKTPFTAEVYFINKTVALAHNWGTSTPILLLDPRYKVTIPFRGYGQFGVRVENSREFIIKIVGASKGALASDVATGMIEAPVVSCLQQVLGDFLVKEKVPALEVPAHTMNITKKVFDLLESQYQLMGIKLVNFTIESINYDPKDESVKKLRSMIDEAARLEIMGDAYRRNQDFYTTERQFNVMQGAAESGGTAGNMMGATMGIGMGFGLTNKVDEMTKSTMTQADTAKLQCLKCGVIYKAGAKFCSECGEAIKHEQKKCTCGAENVATAKFCQICGKPLANIKCKHCGVDLLPDAKFCNECGKQV